MTTKRFLAETGRSPAYWGILALIAMTMEATALFYQYRLDYWPCVLCIHVRIWVLGLLATALFGLGVRHHRRLRVLAHALVAGTGAGLLERSLKLLGVERGTLEGSCSMDSGLPPWFALDQWFPWMFKVWEPCGYTPELPLGITMAEALVAFSALLLAMALSLTLAALGDRRH